jgi:hypothetical protein
MDFRLAMVEATVMWLTRMRSQDPSHVEGTGARPPRDGYAY